MLSQTLTLRRSICSTEHHGTVLALERSRYVTHSIAGLRSEPRGVIQASPCGACHWLDLPTGT